jgi:hypothetical protein
VIGVPLLDRRNGEAETRGKWLYLPEIFDHLVREKKIQKGTKNTGFKPVFLACESLLKEKMSPELDEPGLLCEMKQLRKPSRNDCL